MNKMLIHVLLDSDGILFLSTNIETLEAKRLQLELLYTRYTMKTEEWNCILEESEIAASFDDGDTKDSEEYRLWYEQFLENNPPPDPPETIVWGDLVIKTYETI
jgi:hypothetical protein